MKKFLILLLAALFALSACAKPIAPGKYDQQRNTGKPYTVRGKTYRPYTSAHGFTEEGIASWYGPGFHGKTTANGERYNQNAMTAAHKLLPFGTELRVVNLSNGRSAVVRINDRGPFVGSRVIDLSRRAADQIGMVRAGTARVRLEAINTGGKPILTPDGDMLGKFYIQLGAFKVRSNADNLARTIRRQGLNVRILRNRNTGFDYVQAGPYGSVDQADDVLVRLRSAYPGLFVIAE